MSEQNHNPNYDPRHVNPQSQNPAAAANPNKPTKKESDLFTLANLVFVFSASASYIGLGLAHVNLPRYYPELHQISIAPIKDAIAMGFYGRFFVTLVIAAILTLGFLIFYPLLKRLGLTSLALVNKLTLGAVWFSVSIIVLQEWHEWGLEKRGLVSDNLFNGEFGLFLLGLLIFFGGVLLTAFGIARVRAINTSNNN